MIYTPRASIDLLMHPRLYTQKNKAANTKIEFKGFEISIAMDSSHGDGDLTRTDIRVYKENDDVTIRFLDKDEYMLYGNAETLLRVMKQIEQM